MFCKSVSLCATIDIPPPLLEEAKELGAEYVSFDELLGRLPKESVLVCILPPCMC